MANRSYLYALSNPPSGYRDRPETITGLSEWPYDVPLVYYLLLSGEPRLCASLISDGFDGEDADSRTPLYALSGDFGQGYARLERLAAALRLAAPAGSAQLRASLDEALTFLAEHRDRYFLLETIELDCMGTAEAEPLRQLAQAHLAAARAAGAAVDALPDDDAEAARRLREATRSGSGVLAPFKGLSLDDDFDDSDTPRALGMGFWDTVLYFERWNREEFDKAMAQ